MQISALILSMGPMVVILMFESIILIPFNIHCIRFCSLCRSLSPFLVWALLSRQARKRGRPLAPGKTCLDSQMPAKWSECLTRWSVDAGRECVGRGGSSSNGGIRCASPAVRAFGTLTTHLPQRVSEVGWLPTRNVGSAVTSFGV